ncbi:FG-GAP-like repeat-containing protein [Burkholderiaceae bacterium UC74_6]
MQALRISPTVDTEAALDTKVVLEFSQEVDPSMFSAATVTLQSPTGAVPTAISYSQTTRRLTVTPTVRLAVNTAYLVTVKSSVKSLSGLALAKDLTVPFTTERVHWAQETQQDAITGNNGDLVLFDVDGDGRKDVVRLISGNTGYPALMVSRQLADASLAASTELVPALPGCQWTAIAVGDLDGDGLPDLATLSAPVGGASGTPCGLQVFTRDGSGGLRRGPLRPAGEAANQLRVADLNGDGRDDAVAVDYRDNLILWYQTAGGGLADFVQMSTGGMADLQIGDMNGDGRMDLIGISNYSGPRRVTIYTQLAGGGFAAPTFITIPVGSLGGSWTDGYGPNGIAVGDVNGDGRDDLVATFGGNTPNARLITYLQGADGVLQAQPSVSVYEGPQAVKIADVDGDGKLDIVVGHQGWSTFGVIFQQPGGASFEYLYPVALGQNINNSRCFAVGDLDGNGLPDVVLNVGYIMAVYRQTH